MEKNTNSENHAKKSKKTSSKSESKKYPDEFEAIPSQMNKKQTIYKTNSYDDVGYSWESVLEEFSYEQTLLMKDFGDIAKCFKYNAKKLIKKSATLGTHRFREKAEYYPESFRTLADLLCRLEKKFLTNIKTPEDEQREDSSLGPK